MANNFEVFLADDYWGRRIHYQLRYQVFCLETGYEEAARFPEGEERDSWDEHAAHLLVQQKDSGEWVAAMRLVWPDAEALPIEGRTRIDAALRRAPEQCAEISRLCMVGHYRRRLQGRIMLCGEPGDGVVSGGAMPAETKKQQRTAEILQALLNAAVVLSAERGIAYWYMLTTRALAKILGYVLPMEMQPAGPPCWHRGERHPFLVDVGQVMRGLSHLPHHGPAYRCHSELVAAMPKVVGAE
jgi:N-acyl amino acid synthase of PEP-CTERM/exosortase system